MARNAFLRQGIDEPVKIRDSIASVIPAKAGIQLFKDILAPGYRRGDGARDFLRGNQESGEGRNEKGADHRKRRHPCFFSFHAVRIL
jgi:hypothetical protein